MNWRRTPYYRETGSRSTFDPSSEPLRSVAHHARAVQPVGSSRRPHADRVGGGADLIGDGEAGSSTARDVRLVLGLVGVTGYGHLRSGV